VKRLIRLSSWVLRFAVPGAGALALAGSLAAFPHAALAATPAPAHTGLRIAVVNFGELIQQSPQARAANESLRAEFLPKQRSLQEEANELKAREGTLKKDEATMTQDQRDQAEAALRQREEDFVQRRNQMLEAANTRQSELMSKLTSTLSQVVQNYAKERGYDLVLVAGEGAIYANSALDITSNILTVLKSQPARRAPAGRIH
jgi:outer membrane protein